MYLFVHIIMYVFLYVHKVTAEVNVRSCARVYTVRAEVNARQSNKWTGQAAHLSLTVTIGQPPPPQQQTFLTSESFLSDHLVLI